MSENQLNEAEFDHVGQSGELVFRLGDTRFLVRVDDTLERAILASKQLRDETRRPEPAQTGHTLPISQIQGLIRAGADPVRVAERYGLDEPLVRRFSAAVETEKQYAIEQFLTVPAPKESRVRTVAELIERTLAAARIGMESVSWKATRRGLEPWRITAQFDSAGRTMRAEWTWSMHDNTVSSVNSTARKLMGEREESELPATIDAYQEDMREGNGFTVSTTGIPGDSVRSARIERAVSAWETSSQTDGGADSAMSADTAQPQTDSHTPVERKLRATPTNPFAPRPRTTPRHNAAPNDGTAEVTTAQSSAESLRADASLPHSPSADSAQRTSAFDGASAHGSSPTTGQHTVERSGNSGETGATHTVKPAKRKGRSAVPSWDEILFGD